MGKEKIALIWNQKINRDLFYPQKDVTGFHIVHHLHATIPILIVGESTYGGGFHHNLGFRIMGQDILAFRRGQYHPAIWWILAFPYDSELHKCFWYNC